MSKLNFFKISFLVVILFSIFIHLLTLNQMGRTWDEHAYVNTGYRFINLIEQGRIFDSYFIEKPDHPPLAKYLYGVSAQFDATGNILPDGEYEFKYDFPITRIISVILGVLATALVMLIGWQFISPTVSIIAGFIFTAIPVVLAMTQLVTIEASTLFFFSLALYFYLLLLTKYSRIKLILAGITLGLLLCIKFTNIVAIPIWIAIYFVKKMFDKSSISLKHLIVIIFLGLVTFGLLWPKAVVSYHEVWQNIQQIRFSSSVIPSVSLFLGKVQPAPIYYYLVYFFINIPVVYLILFFIGSFFAIRSKNWVLLVLLIAFLLPFSQSLYIIRRNGLRYIIEIFIPFSLIAGYGIQTLIGRITSLIKQKSLVWLGFGFFLGIYVLFFLKPISPYYLDYFNEIVGGTSGVYRNHTFDLDFWGQGQKEAMQYLENNVSAGATVALELYPTHTAFLSSKFKYVPDDLVYNPQYIIVNYLMDIRVEDREKKSDNYRLIYNVKADGADLVHIYQRIDVQGH